MMTSEIRRQHQQRAAAKLALTVTAILAAALVMLLCSGCTVLAETENQAKQTKTKLALMIGTDAAEISHPDSWHATGINNSNAVGGLAKGIITTTGINAGVDLLQPISNSAGTALTNVSQ